MANADVTGETATGFRPPAVPLVACDPYFSIWSMSDRLTDEQTKHWTGAEHSLTSMIRVDGTAYRLMGAHPRNIQALEQTGLSVYPTRTVYNFEGAGIGVTLTFLTPLLPDDLDIMARPVTYITWDISAVDGEEHDCSIYFDAGGELATNTREQNVTWSRLAAGSLEVLSIGCQEQNILKASGDDRRIDWGYLYAYAEKTDGLSSVINHVWRCKESFRDAGRLPDWDITGLPRKARDIAAAFTFNLGRVGSQRVSRHIMLAYDDIWSIEYLDRKLKPYWRRNGWDARQLLETSAKEYEALSSRCADFDVKLESELLAYGSDYKDLCSLAYRQCICAHKLAADVDGTPLFFSKENYSNGCIATVDVTYPASPFYLLFNPDLLVGCVKPILDYASLPNRWKFPFAPHDLGQYPLANGQVYGGGERTERDQMPVEECGNMLILMGALHKKGYQHLTKEYWPVLSRWAEYLAEKGLDPENQLCTDDFAGHLGHNANLSIKAIVALGVFAMMAGELGEKEAADTYRKTAEGYAAKWRSMANDGDHYRLTFDGSGTWSQKYNLVWDRILGLDLFPAEVASKEVAFYLTKQNQYGLPLDNRRTFTKLDWIVWSACLAESPEDFKAIVKPARRFANNTPDRVPLSDWYETLNAKKCGFQARSVVGGLFIKLMIDRF